jgi:formate dehydrogenase maturation protein FdhE
MQMFKHMFDAAAKMEIEQTQMKRQIAQISEKAEATQNTLEDIKETIIYRDQDWRRYINRLFNKAVANSGTGDYQGFRNETYRMLEPRAGCRLDKRLNSLKSRMALNGAAKAQIDAATKLDVIENDKKLKEIYTFIIKELAIRYSVKVEEM